MRPYKGLDEGRGYKKTGLYRLLSLDIAPFPAIIVQATGQKAEAGTLLEDLLGCCCVSFAVLFTSALVVGRCFPLFGAFASL